MCNYVYILYIYTYPHHCCLHLPQPLFPVGDISHPQSTTLRPSSNFKWLYCFTVKPYYTTISNCSVLMLLTIYVAGYFVPTTPHFCSGLTQKLRFRSFFASSSAKTQPILLALNTWGWVDLKNNKSQEGSKNTLIKKHRKSLSVCELSAKYVVAESSQPNMGRTCWWPAEMGVDHMVGSPSLAMNRV